MRKSKPGIRAIKAPLCDLRAVMLVVGVGLIAATGFVINRYDLLQFPTTDIDYDVLDARYAEGKWPRTWEDVEKDELIFGGVDADKGTFDRVTLSPGLGDTCTVVAEGHNVIGLRISKKDVLKWTPAIALEVWAREKHTSTAADLLDMYLDWVISENKGVLRLDAKTSMDCLRDFGELPPKIASFRLVDELRDKKLSQVSIHSPCLIVKFADGTVRVVDVDGTVKTLPK